MPEPMNHEEAKLPHSQRLELFVQDVWGAMDAHGVDHLHVAYVLNQIMSDLLWKYLERE
jgi:hypothetical protein